jgi:hypothetical protein
MSEQTYLGAVAKDSEESSDTFTSLSVVALLGSLVSRAFMSDKTAIESRYERIVALLLKLAKAVERKAFARVALVLAYRCDVAGLRRPRRCVCGLTR